MKLLLIRFSVLWIWIVTIFITIAVYLYKGTLTKMETGEILDNLSTVFALIIPQVTIIFTFFSKIPIIGKANKSIKIRRWHTYH